MGTKDTLAARLRSLRKRRGFSQGKLADLAGTAEATVKSIEQGHRLHPRIDTVEKLARALGCDRDALLPRTPARRA